MRFAFYVGVLHRTDPASIPCSAVKGKGIEDAETSKQKSASPMHGPTAFQLRATVYAKLPVLRVKSQNPTPTRIRLFCHSNPWFASRPGTNIQNLVASIF